MTMTTATRTPRIDQPVIALPAALAALQQLGTAIADEGIPPITVELVNLRVSQINGCAVCLEGGIRAACGPTAA